jgi:hypothetical protein
MASPCIFLGWDCKKCRVCNFRNFILTMEKQMKKLLLTATALALLAGSSAYARVDVDVNIGGPAVLQPAPVYVAPAPVYVPPTGVIYEPHHRSSDFRYWQERREREAWEHAHPGGRWDHNGWVHAHR